MVVNPQRTVEGGPVSAVAAAEGEGDDRQPIEDRRQGVLGRGGRFSRRGLSAND